MLYEFNVYQMEIEDHLFWVADSKFLKGCTGQGETSEEAIAELEVNEKEWLETAKEFGIPIPHRSIKTDKTYSGKISLRVSPYVHESAVLASSSLGISLNQFINDALVKYTEDVRQNHGYVKYSLRDETDKIVNFQPRLNNATPNSISRELEEM